jgi:hypothetical protein
MHPTPSSPIPTDADLLASVQSLIGPAARDQVWLLLQDADGVPLPLVVPIEDVPMRPDAVPVVARAVAAIAQAAQAASVTLVWERLGPDRLDDEETAFVSAVREAVAASLPVRAQLLSSDRGVRLLPPGPAA